MTNDDPNAPVGSNPPRRTPRQGIGGSPVGSTLSIVLAVVAVVAGFLILRNITDDSGSSGEGVSADSTVPVDSTSDTTDSTTTTTTEPPLVTAGATVVVANSSGVPGSAGRMTTELAGAGFEMVEPAINATSSGLEASIVYYDPTVTAAIDVAGSVARVMGGLAVEAVPTPVPVEGASLNGAGVLVMLGTNEADKTLAELVPAAEPTNVTSPEVSGADSTTGTSTG